MGKGYNVWFHNNPLCEEVILAKGRYEAVLSGYGRNDFWLEFLDGKSAL